MSVSHDEKSERFKSAIRERVPEGIRVKFGGGKVYVRCAKCWIATRNGPRHPVFHGDAAEAIRWADEHEHAFTRLHEAKWSAKRLAEETDGSYFRSYRN